LLIQDSISIAANATNTNGLANKQMNRIPLDTGAVMSLRDTGSATGLQRSFNVNNVNEMERGLVSAQNRIPIVEDTVSTGMVAGPGALLQLSVENTTGGALTYFYCLEIEDVDPAQLAA